MRVLHVIDALGVGGGAEHSLAALLPELRHRGVESRVVCLSSRVGGLQERLVSGGFDVAVLPAGPWPRRVLALRKVIQKDSPDLVHATLILSCLLARLACIGLDIPLLNSLVNTSYDPVRAEMLGIASWKLRSLRAVDRVTARHLADHFHVISDAVRTEAVQVLGIDPAKITVIPRGRDATALGARDIARRSAARAALSITPDALVVLNVGRQDKQKGQLDLVRAFLKVRDIHPGALLLIAGRPGDASEGIVDLISAMRAQDSVRLLGHRDDVADLYVAADVFALPSLYEGLGCSLLEAMALGTPIIGSDAPAIGEVLGGGAYGVITPRGDVDRLAEAMSELLAEPARGVAIASKAHQQYLERYELHQVIDKTVTLYRNLTGDRSLDQGTT